MQRSDMLRACAESNGPIPDALRAAARSSARFCPSADSGGMRPSGGSVMIDVRSSAPLGYPSSIQIASS